LVVLVKFSKPGGKTPLRKPIRGREIISTKPRSNRAYVLFRCFIVWLSCDIFHTPLSLSLRFNGHSPGEHRVSRCLLKQRMMEVVVTDGAIGRAKLQSNHYHQQTSTKSFLQAGCPSYRPTNSVKALKGYISYSYGTI